MQLILCADIVSCDFMISRSSDICCSWRSIKFKLPGVSVVKTELKKSDRAVAFSLSVFAPLLWLLLSAVIVSCDFSFCFYSSKTF